MHPDCELHDTGPGHPENPLRLEAIRARFERSALAQELDRIEPEPADLAAVARVHHPDHLAEIERAGAHAPALLDGGDTILSRGSLRAARLAVGGTLAAVERVLRREWRNAFVACRPPGHHAEPRRSMGFCIFNQVAIAARTLRDVHGVSKVAIVDFDVHHGNGTQHAFESDPTVYYASLHQWPLYPGTGAASERGTGAGAGCTLNCPMPPGAGEREWLHALESRIFRELALFGPDFLLVSAGFDAHERDPLANQRLTTATYGVMTRLLADFAREHCAGRLVSVLEGGYHLEALADSVHAHVEALHAAAT
jgi:acetoin utilization deacetylase AcuC-like enzyme